jgi:hypothetical protein
MNLWEYVPKWKPAFVRFNPADLIVVFGCSDVPFETFSVLMPT